MIRDHSIQNFKDPFNNKQSSLVRAIRWMLVTLIVSVHNSIYKDSPAQFTSFYCNLGTMTLANSGDYSCVSPKVIPRADKFGLSLVEFNTGPSAWIWFKAKVISAVGTNLASVSIRLNFTTSYTMMYGYQVIVIANLPNNKWIDLVNVQILDTSIHSLYAPNMTSHEQTYVFYEKTEPTPKMTQGYTYSITFVGSFGVSLASPGTSIELSFVSSFEIYSLSYFAITVNQYVGLKTFIGGIIFVNTGFAGANNRFYQGGSRLTAQNFLKNSNNQPYGPPYSTKCLIGIYGFVFGQDFSITLANHTSSNNYYKIMMNTPLTNTKNFIDYKFICAATTTPLVCGDDEYEDPLTGECFTSSNACPVPTTSSISLTAKNWCQKCIQPQCLDCVAATRSTCLDCDQTLSFQLINGFCDCLTFSGMTYSNACVLCSILFPNCLKCVNEWSGCTQCVANYWPDTSGDCVDCPTFQPNCVTCASNGRCTQCVANYWPDTFGNCVDCPTFQPNCVTCASNGRCTQCATNYWVSVTGSCVTCSVLHPRCLICNPTDGACTLCDAGYGTSLSGDCVVCSNTYSFCSLCTSDTAGCDVCYNTYFFDSNNDCVDCITLHPMCSSCAALDGACLSCLTGFGVTATDDCESCSVLYTNCITCSKYNTGCSQCQQTYGIDPIDECDSCSNLFPNCIECYSYSTGCTLCPVGYGIDSSGQCAICQSLHPNCAQCFIHSSGCTKCLQGSVLTSLSTCMSCAALYSIDCVLCNSVACTECKETFGIASSGSCQACSVLYSQCRLCISHNSGCSECNEGYGLNSTGKCATCVSFYPNCSQCTNHNTGCLECATYFGITDTKHCQNCGILYPSCLLCSSYDTGCTECVTGFGVNSLGGCTACSTLFSNCQICTSYDTGCTSCISGYGKNSTDLCQLCTTFYSDCALCDSYDTGCTQCMAGANIHLINSVCKRCTQIDPECVTCQPNIANSDIVCNSCSVGYYLDSSQNICIKCSTVIDDCEQCFYNSTVAKVHCTLCSQQFLVDDRFRCQKCKMDVYYERKCFYLPGCSSLAVINGTLICLACTMPNFEFSMKIKKCVCQTGFTFNTSDDTCRGKCGDGIKVPSEDCDDGNLNFGDGCDEMCKIQSNFKCTENNSSLSTCIMHQNVLLSLDYILKFQGENKAEVYFKLEPAPSLLSMIDWQKSIKFEFPAIDRKPIISYSYENGVLKVLMGYFGDIEGKTCQISVKFDSSTIVSNPQPLLFEITGKNEKLNYESDSSNSSQKTVGIISFALGISALCCFIVSSYFHKLIGLETLQFIQLIYFSRILYSGSSQSSVMAFNSLKYSNGYNQINLTGAKPDANISEMPPLFVRIQLQMYYLDNCNMMLIPILLATLAYVIYFLRRSRAQSQYRETKQLAIRDNILDMGRKITWIFQNFIFSYTLALFYLTVFQMLLYELSDLSDQTQTSQLYVTMSFSVSLVILVYIFLIFCSQTIHGIKNYFDSRQNKQNHFDQSKALNDKDGKDYHPLYVPFYLLYQFSLIILINTVLLEFTYLAQAMAGLILLYTIVFACWRPYSLSIHNYANIYHQFVLIMFFALEILGKLNLLDDTLKGASLYTLVALISMALMIQMMRVYKFRNSLQRKFIVEKLQKKQKPAELKLIKPNNPYIMKTRKLIDTLGQKVGEKQIADITDQTILGREMLRKKLRQQKQIQDQNAFKLEQFLSNQIEDDRSRLKKLKDRMRIKTKARQQWIFR